MSQLLQASNPIAFTSAIPFDTLITSMATTITGAITFTKNTTGAVAGFGTILRLTANGTHTPNFSAFKNTNGSQVWVNTNGTVNVVIFFYDGVDYWYTIYQQAASLTQLSTPGSFAAVAAGTTQINLSWADVANESNYEIQEASLSDYSDATTINSPAANATSYSRTGLTASQTRYYRIRAKGDGITYSDSAWATANATTAAADVTAPTVSSATVINATTIRIVFSEVVTATNLGWSFKKNGAANNPTAVSGSGTNTLDFTVPVIVAGDTILRSYESATGNTIDGSSNELVSFTDSAVTNSLVAASIASTAWHSRIDPALGRTERVAGADIFLSKVEDQVPASATAMDFVQTVEANQPKYIAAGINNLPSIEINAGQWLITGTFPNLAEPITRVAVIEYKTLPGAVKYTMNKSGGGGGANFGNDTDNKFFMFAGVILKATSHTPAANTPYLIWLEFVGDGATDKLYIDGVLVATGNAGTDPLMAAMILGMTSTTSAHAWIGDHMTYSGIMSEADRLSITNELKTKYDIA